MRSVAEWLRISILNGFMAAKSALWAHVGKDFKKRLRTHEEYDTAENDVEAMKKLNARVVESFICYHFMANADQNKYGSLMETFKTRSKSRRIKGISC